MRSSPSGASARNPRARNSDRPRPCPRWSAWARRFSTWACSVSNWPHRRTSSVTETLLPVDTSLLVHACFCSAKYLHVHTNKGVPHGLAVPDDRLGVRGGLRARHQRHGGLHPVLALGADHRRRRG